MARDTEPHSHVLSALAGELVEALPVLEETEQRVALALYRLLAEGEPVLPLRTAELVGLPAERVSVLLDAWPGVYRVRRGDSLEEARGRVAALAPDPSARRAARDTVHPLLAAWALCCASRQLRSSRCGRRPPACFTDPVPSNAAHVRDLLPRRSGPQAPDDHRAP